MIGAYLDNGATTRMDLNVVDAMLPFFEGVYGAPASNHSVGKKAKEAVESARDIVAKFINAEKDEIFFTSGASESNNLALKGIARTMKDVGKHIITTKIEHRSILEACRQLEEDGYEITYLNIDEKVLLSQMMLGRQLEKTQYLLALC